MPQQQITAVQQLGRLTFERGGFGELLIDQGQLLGQGVHLACRTLEGLAGFRRHQIQLACQLGKTRTHAFAGADEAGAHDRGCRINRQTACGIKKRIQRGAQAHALVTHDVHHPLRIVHQGLLCGQVGVAVAQVAFGKGVESPLDSGEQHARAQIHIGLLGRCALLQRGCLTRIPFGAHVGNVVTDRAQGTLISGNGCTADAQHGTHGSLLVDGN